MEEEFPPVSPIRQHFFDRLIPYINMVMKGPSWQIRISARRSRPPTSAAEPSHAATRYADFQAPISTEIRLREWGRWDLNPRPPGPKPGVHSMLDYGPHLTSEPPGNNANSLAEVRCASGRCEGAEPPPRRVLPDDPHRVAVGHHLDLVVAEPSPLQHAP